MDKISKHILEQIKEEKIKPLPRWHFLMVKILLIAALIFSIVVGGVVMSMVFLKLGDLDWRFISLAGEKGLPKIFDVLPVLWMILLIMLVWLSILVFERTETGYKYSPVWVVLGSVLFSTVLAGCFYFTSGAEKIEEAMRGGIPFYEMLEREKEARFNLPERGILPGRVLVIISPKELTMEDMRNQEWQVRLLPEAVMRVDISKLNPGQMIMVTGRKMEDGQFVADDLRPKRGMKRLMMKLQ
jgi:hypothetical protein